MTLGSLSEAADDDFYQTTSKSYTESTVRVLVSLINSDEEATVAGFVNEAEVAVHLEAGTGVKEGDRIELQNNTGLNPEDYDLQVVDTAAYSSRGSSAVEVAGCIRL